MLIIDRPSEWILGVFLLIRSPITRHLLVHITTIITVTVTTSASGKVMFSPSLVCLSICEQPNMGLFVCQQQASVCLPLINITETVLPDFDTRNNWLNCEGCFGQPYKTRILFHFLSSHGQRVSLLPARNHFSQAEVCTFWGYLVIWLEWHGFVPTMWTSLPNSKNQRCCPS